MFVKEFGLLLKIGVRQRNKEDAEKQKRRARRKAERGQI